MSQDKEQIKPAWVDESIPALEVNIADKSRLRKLKQKEKEDVIKADEFANRLRQQHSKLTNHSDLFNWAKVEEPKDQSRKQSEAITATSEDLDPISLLLQSNTQIFSKQSSVLKPGHLSFQKLVNANYGHEHQSVVTSLNFHPSESILMTSGLDRKVKLF